MIYLNFTDLNEETQERLFANSKEDVKHKYGKDIMDNATKHNTSSVSYTHLTLPTKRIV